MPPNLILPARTPDAEIRTAFLAHLPRVRACVRYALRHVPGPDDRADLVCEALALAWRHFVALARRGKDPGAFVTTLALRGTQAARGGRRLSGADRPRDVLSPRAGARHGFALVRLDDFVPAPGTDPSGPGAEVVAAALLVDPKARVPEQAAFRVDFPAWRAGLPARHRAVADALAGGDGTGEVAARLGVTPGRVSQLRDALRASWRAFHGLS